MNNEAKFNKRAFVSVLTTLSFILLAISGFVLFITPPGRVANWTGWQFMGLTKIQWGSMHIWFSLTFFAVSLFHIYFNWRALLNYFKNRISRNFGMRLEWVAALLLCVLVYLGTLFEAPPFSSLIAFNDSIKNSWEQEDQRAPIPHAELLTLAELATEAKVELDAILSSLKQKGISDSSPESIVGDLAKTHNMTPAELFDLVLDNNQKKSGTGHPKGLGRMTLEQVCSELNMDLAATLEKLQELGFEAKSDMILRDIAYKNNKKPPQLLELLREN